MPCLVQSTRRINGMALRSSNCSSRMYVSLWRGWTASWSDAAVSRFSTITQRSSACTRPVARGRGVAKALLRKIEEEVRGAGKSVLRLETGTNQQEAIGLYEAMGFQPWGPFGPSVAMPATSRPASFSNRCSGSSNDQTRRSDDRLIGSCADGRSSERSGRCDARVLQSINSESIMAGRRSLICRSTSHVSTEIWLTSAAIG